MWIALTTALTAAIGTYLGYKQFENTLIEYNQSATDLKNVKAWWNALPAEEQASPDNIDALVEHTEQILKSEHDGWVQNMQDALANLRKSEESKPKERDVNERNATDGQHPKKSSVDRSKPQAAKTNPDNKWAAAADATTDTEGEAAHTVGVTTDAESESSQTVGATIDTEGEAAQTVKATSETDGEAAQAANAAEDADDKATPSTTEQDEKDAALTEKASNKGLAQQPSPNNQKKQ